MSGSKSEKSIVENTVYTLYNEKIHYNLDEKDVNGESKNDDISLSDLNFTFNSKNKREKTILLSKEENFTLFSDIQLCSILDTIIYECEDKYSNLINPIFNAENICDINYISYFFYLFGFEYHIHEPQINTEHFFNLVLPFQSNDFNEMRKKTIASKLNPNKSLMLWLSYGFSNSKDKETIEKFRKDFDVFSYLKTSEMSKDTCFFLHQVGVALHIKFTNVYIQNSNDEYTYKAFDLGDTNAANRIFIGLYKNDEKVCYYLPKMVFHKKANKSSDYKNECFDEYYCHFIFLPNYGPIYLKNPSGSQFPYYQSEYDTFYLNNDFPIYINNGEKDVHIKNSITSLSQARLLFQTIFNQDKKIKIDEKIERLFKIIFQKIFNIQEKQFGNDNDSVTITIKDDNSIDITSRRPLEYKNNIYTLRLLPPINTLSYIPNLKISSPLEIVNIAVISLSRIFFIAKYDNSNKTSIFFGDGDFGSSSLDDMFVCPTCIETDYLINSFILSSRPVFVESDIKCISSGIIVLHNKGDKTMVTHYSRTDHIWKLEKEFDIGFKINKDKNDQKEKSNYIFFNSDKYYVFYLDEGKYKVKAYNFYDDEPLGESVDISRNKYYDNYYVIHFYNEKFFAETSDGDDKAMCVLLKLSDFDEDGEEEEDADEDEVRINKLVIQHEEEEERNDCPFRLEVHKNPNSKDPLPIALEINQRLHVYKYKEKDKKHENTISSILYHPANKNANLYYSILSIFYRYRRHFDHDIKPISERPCIIHTSIDCGYTGNFNSIFKTGSCPGIYADRTDIDVYHEYHKQWNDPPFIIYLYFSNGLLQTGFTELRTLSQLAAAFACSYAISIYGSDGRITCYEPQQQNTVLWNFDRFLKMERNLVATYGTLLEMKNDYEFEFALNVLETTKNLVSDFKEFLHSISSY
ncbi:hypothetical protein M9Y10_017726 [Tritrichomonas musculus]|uniref:Uncharacterized protein n=1 Tax=Tritrichomonas musculus TaxID=1915356 RepID=A0ABR2HUP1_9EUKA